VRAHLVLGRAERDLLRRAAVRDLGALGDIELALRLDDGATARELRDEFVPVLALLDDLGWEEQDPRETFPVTLEPAALRACARRWLDEVDGSLVATSGALADGAARWEPAVRAEVDEDLDLRGACVALLGSGA
jgi:hypothetical protein